MPDKIDATGERARNGRFLKGHKGIGGRPPGVSLRKLLERRGENAEDAVYEAFAKLRELARDGDVAAIREILNRLCGPVRAELFLETEHHDAPPSGPPIPQPEDLAGYLRELAADLENETEPDTEP